MSQQRCATCRFFVPGSNATTGQCSHPARQAVFGLVMVRAQELACRRGMNDHDWETAEVGQPQAAAVPAEAVPQVIALAGDGEPVPIPPLANVVAPIEAGQAARPERSTEPTDRRRGYQGTPTPVLVNGDAPPPRRELNTDGIPIVRQRHGVVAEAHRNAQRRREQARARREEQETRIVPADAGEAPAPATVAEEERPLAADARRASSHAAPERHGEAGHQRVWTGTGQPESWQHADTLRDGQASGAVHQRDDADDSSAEEVAPAGYAGQEVPAGSSLPTPAQPEQLGEWEHEWWELRRSACAQQQCGTCRDFRASDTPGRGWCGNPFAHSHRQLVQFDELACLSTLGTWWLPADDVWLAKAGLSSPQPTPLADELYQQLTRVRRRPRA